MIDIGVPRFHEDGSFAGYIGTCIDVTERKDAEDALADIGHRLIQAHEEERVRIGRELHDDIAQRLALLLLELEQLKQHPGEVGSRVQLLQDRAEAISDDVQALAQDLHSSKLEYLGAVAAIRSWCEDVAERQKLEIDFQANVQSNLPSQIGLSLLRVVQEALQNAVKYSGVKRVKVQLREDADEIHLLVSDSGKGFDLEAALRGRGLGLTSMRGRIRLVNGTLLIDSKPMGGTRIEARVPLRSEQECAVSACHHEPHGSQVSAHLQHLS
jgi:signal transduction histidine kinase